MAILLYVTHHIFKNTKQLEGLQDETKVINRQAVALVICNSFAIIQHLTIWIVSMTPKGADSIRTGADILEFWALILLDFTFLSTTCAPILHLLIQHNKTFKRSEEADEYNFEQILSQSQSLQSSST